MGNLENQVQSIIHQYFDSVPTKIYEQNNGYNNTTRLIEVNGEQFILRIYQTHNENEKVDLEHEVLLKLNQIKGITFQVPKPLLLADGRSYIKLLDGSERIACIFHYIEGVNPRFTESELLFSYGKNTGILLHALSELDLFQPFIYRPYYEIEHTHPRCPIPKVINWCMNPPKEFKEFKLALDCILEQLHQFQEQAPLLKTLPHQVIHGDLNESNVLVNDKKIIAFLDFEFVTYDLRIMEAAVSISELIINEPIEDKLWKNLESYIAGLISVQSFSYDEVKVLPLLITLRRLDVFIHFLGRFIDGKDDSHILKEQLEKAQESIKWINEHENMLIEKWISQIR